MKRIATLSICLITLITGCTPVAKPTPPTTVPATGPTTAASTRPSQEARIADNSVVKLDVPYAGTTDPLQTLDIYSPLGAVDAPIVLFVHGGEWTKHDKSEVSFKPKYFNENGVVFVSINYRLNPAVTHPAQVNDLATAIAWTRAHAAEFGGNGSKINIIGHSAGCHLVTLVALDPQYLASAGLKPTDLAGVIAWSGGAYDLVDKAKTSKSYAGYINANFGSDLAVQAAASPIHHIGQAPTPRFLFASYDKANDSYTAAQKMVDGITAAGGSARHILLEGKTHFTANHEIGAPGDITGVILLDFVRQSAVQVAPAAAATHPAVPPAPETPASQPLNK